VKGGRQLPQKAFRNTIHEEAGFIPIGKLEELSRSIRSKGERRGVSFDSPSFGCSTWDGRTPSFLHPVRFRTETHNDIIPFEIRGF